jgi:tetratricopeptide (TPR) repeat protein
MEENTRFNTLGEQMRQAREARGLSQATLARPEFTPGLINAIEHNTLRPSRTVLAVLAPRLGLAVDDLRVLDIPNLDVPDLAALDEDVAYQLDHVKRHINLHRGSEALALVEEAADSCHLYLDQLSIGTRYRLHRMRGMAYLRLAAPARAHQELEIALPLAYQLDDPQEAVRVRNALGTVYYTQDMAVQALEQHEACLHAIQAGAVKDLTLRLTIYYNLGNDYWAINENVRAISMYKEALEVLDDLDDPPKRAGVCWGLRLAYQAQDDLDRAKLYAGEALQIYEAAQDSLSTAQV